MKNTETLCGHAHAHAATRTEPVTGVAHKTAMKPPMRRSFAVLVFIVLLGSFCTMVRRALEPVPSHDDPAHLESSLRHLATVDPGEVLMHWKEEKLLEGQLSAADMRDMWGDDHMDPAFLPILRSWHQLKHYDPSIIGRLASLLSIPERIPSCAIVGNSGILLRANHGAHIDSHATVFRINNARISGYEAHVGSKTNFSFIHRYILRECVRQSNCFCHPYGNHIPILLYTGHPAHFLDIAACNTTSSSRNGSHISVIDPRHNIICERIAKYYSLRRFVSKTGRAPEEWERAHDGMKFHYSSGMQAVMVAVAVCNRVSVFGFGKSSDAKHHYHDDQWTEEHKHDYEAEYDFYHDLSKHPHVVPFLKDSGFVVPPVIFYH